MDYVIGDYEHGQIRLIGRGVETTVSIRWPFDKSLDEWITLSISFRNADLRESVGATEGQLSLSSCSGSLRMERLRDDAYLLDVTGKNSLGPCSAQIEIPLGIARQLRNQLRAV